MNTPHPPGNEQDILVAGGAGFIGSHLHQQIGGEIFDRRTGQEGLDLALVKERVRGKELVYHLANIPAHRLSVSSPYEVLHNNYLVTLNFAEACRLHDVKMVFASSFGVYGKQPLPFKEDGLLAPTTPYGAGKKACEELLQLYHDLYGMDVIIVRPSNVWGDRDSLHEPLQVLPLWLRKVQAGEELVVHGELTSRDFTHVSDFVAGIRKAAAWKGFEVFNICAGQEIRLLDIARSLTGQVRVEPLPPTEVERWQGDITKARSLLEWQPRVRFWEEFSRYAASRLGRPITVKEV
ncbi:MAG: NAD-dependent epimerase/dehydratase family protein [Candidatus Aenigmarchaeota archaeon]|nr:NAD-dependent epimerase/dehydratase family protein [Candidatus Aenigmarchaeota archaeon]